MVDLHSPAGDDGYVRPAETLDEDREMAALQARVARIEGTLEEHLPRNTAEQYRQAALQEYAQYADPAHPEDPEVAEAEITQWTAVFANAQENDRRSIAISLAERGVQDEDMPAFVAALVQTAQATTPSNQPITFFRMDSLIQMSQSVQEAQMYAQLAKTWNEQLVDGMPEAEAWARQDDAYQVIVRLSNAKSSTAPKLPVAEVQERFGVIMEAHAEAYTLDRKADEDTIKVFLDGVETIGRYNHDSSQMRQYIELFRNVKDHASPVRANFLHSTASYIRGHEITPAAMDGWIQKLLPAMEAGEPQVALLSKRAQVGGKLDGRFGGADFVCHAYALLTTPENINELMMILQEIPTYEYGKWRQNRDDALSLAEPFGSLRDFIHDQAGDVHEVVSAMIRYYETHDRSLVEPFVPQVGPRIFNLANYDMVVESLQSDDPGQLEQMTAINVLHRLEQNTRATDMDPPITTDERFNQLQRQVQQAEGPAKQPMLAEALGYVTEHLRAAMRDREVGLDPRMVTALTWLEHQNAVALKDALKDMPYEDQLGLYKQPWFQKIVEFQELTCAPGTFDEAEFDQFMDRIRRSSSAEHVYTQIMQRVTKHGHVLAERYKVMGQPQRVHALWSDTNRQLMGLIIPKPAITEVGKRLQREAETLPALRRTSD